MRLVFVNRSYWPEETATAQLLRDLAEALAVEGHEVVVLARQPAAPATGTESSAANIHIRRVKGTSWGRQSLTGRLCDFVSFQLAAAWHLVRIVRRGDTVIALSDPPLIGILVWAVSRVRGFRLVHWVHDIYPEVATALITVAPLRWALGAFRPLRNLAWRRSAACVVLGRDMAGVLERCGVAPARLHIIPNWAPAGLEPIEAVATAGKRREWDLNGKFVVAYSGNLGRVHELLPVLDMAAELATRPDIVFLFIGGGAQRAELERAAARRQLSNVRFLPPQPRCDLHISMGVGDVHLITLRPSCAPFVFPSKLYGSAAIGRPVLFLGPVDSEIAQLVTRSSFGHAFSAHQISAAAAAIIQLADRPEERTRCVAAAIAFHHRCGGVHAATAAWLRLLNGLDLR